MWCATKQTSLHLFIITLCIVVLQCQQDVEKDSPCFLSTNEIGVCLPINSCAGAIQQINQNEKPPMCRFRGQHPLVCCPKENATNIKALTSISEQKCEDYKKIKGHATEPIGFPIDDRTEVRAFPHMAALGYGNASDIQWLCAGALISERFVLAPAHCVWSHALDDVQFVRLGDTDLYSDRDSAKPQQLRVTDRFVHPGFKLPAKYNDIALLRLERDVDFDEYVQPACLQTSFDLSNTRPIATGWEILDHGHTATATLQKIYLWYYSVDKCRNEYAPYINQRLLKDGIRDDQQICAVRDDAGWKDSCQGDTGGPLQIQTSTNPQTYHIVGMISFGTGCGLQNIPGVYTRVSAYVPWIEHIVWPQQTVPNIKD